MKSPVLQTSMQATVLPRQPHPLSCSGLRVQKGQCIPFQDNKNDFWNNVFAVQKTCIGPFGDTLFPRKHAPEGPSGTCRTCPLKPWGPALRPSPRTPAHNLQDILLSYVLRAPGPSGFPPKSAGSWPLMQAKSLLESNLHLSGTKESSLSCACQMHPNASTKVPNTWAGSSPCRPPGAPWHPRAGAHRP